MPDHGPIKMFTGPVANVKTTKRDGSPLITSKGNPWAIIGFKQDDGTWLNLSSFDFNNNAILQPGAMVKVGYTEEQQVDGFGQPKLYNGVPQYNRNITAVALLEDAPSSTQIGQTAPPATNATPHSLKPPFDPELSARQTAANDAVQAANTEATVNKVFELIRWLDTFDAAFEHIHRTLTGTSDKAQADAFKALHEKVEKTLGATPEKVEATPPASADAPADSDIPW